MRFVSDLAFACIFLVLFSGAARGQGKVWEVPANSTGNRLILTVENSGSEEVVSSVVRVRNAPEYIDFDPRELSLGALAPGESQEVMLTFSVNRTAPVGQVDEITVVISGKSGSWQKVLSFRYLPPSTHRLEQNFPNPFNPSTTIQYQLPTAGRVTLKLYDVLGREVGTLVEEEQEAGYYDSIWNAESAASGVYFCRLLVQGEDGTSYSSIKKMLLMK